MAPVVAGAPMAVALDWQRSPADTGRRVGARAYVRKAEAPAM